MPTRILGIETSCDETAAGVVEDGRTVLSNVIASQSELHAQYGGVFPEMASRAHVQLVHQVIDAALQQAHVALRDIDAIAVTRGPGLVGSLVVGMNAAKGLALGTGLPLLGINHLEGHIYSLWLTSAVRSIKFPVLALIVSGGHTELVLVTGHLEYQRLGGTLDDAAGEAFDKVGRLLGMPYPAGAHMERAAQRGNPGAFNFPRAWMDDSWDFSFSGLKTAVARAVKSPALAGSAAKASRPKELPVDDLAASFQAAAIDVLAEKTAQAAEKFKARGILIAGGVSANRLLRSEIEDRAGKVPVYAPPQALCTDNAAMIAAAAHQRLAAGHADDLTMDVLPTWPLAI